MSNAQFRVPPAVNEPVKAYAPGSAEKSELKAALACLKGEGIEIPLVIDGQHVRATETVSVVAPHEHGRVLATTTQGGASEIARAILAATTAQKTWGRMPWEERAAVFLKAADLLAGKWRA